MHARAVRCRKRRITRRLFRAGTSDDALEATISALDYDWDSRDGGKIVRFVFSSSWISWIARSLLIFPAEFFADRCLHDVGIDPWLSMIQPLPSFE